MVLTSKSNNNTTMKEEIEEQLKKITAARIRLNAEIEIAKTMMPDDVDSERHYNGLARAIDKYPQYS